MRLSFCTGTRFANILYRAVVPHICIDQTIIISVIKLCARQLFTCVGSLVSLMCVYVYYMNYFPVSVLSSCVVHDVYLSEAHSFVCLPVKHNQTDTLYFYLHN